MAYNTKPIITDVDGNPISQYYNKELDQYEPVEGSSGGNKVVVENNQGLSLIPILDKLSQLTGTVIDEETRKSNEALRIALYDDLLSKVTSGFFKGEKGDTGNGLEYTWNGTQLGVRVEGDTEYVFVDLKGEKGDTGEIENLTSGMITDALGYIPLSEDSLPDNLETTSGAQAKANQAEQNAKDYTDQEISSIDIPDSTWESIQNKPDTFTPSEHSHSIGNITGLQNELNSKETPSGAQAKANQAEQNAKDYTDSELANFEGMVEHGNEYHTAPYAKESDLDAHKADYVYQTPTIVGTQIRISKQSDTNRLYFKLDSNLEGSITISLDGGITELPLQDIDGNQVTYLDKGFVEVVAEANFFTLRPRGGGIIETLPPQIENFNATVSNGKIELTWTISDTTYLGGYTFTYKVNAIPSNVNDGIKVFADKSSTSLTIEGLTNDVLYYIRAFPYNSKKQYQTEYRVVQAIPKAGIPISDLPIGAKVKFGRYSVESEESQDIIWQIADKNHTGYPDDSITLITEKIIDIRAFDAKEPSNSDSFRQEYGNNRYKDSNIRQWLNKSGYPWFQKTHGADEPPTDEGTNNYGTGYDDKPGFLSDFTDEELNAILDTTLTVAKNTAVDGGGTETVVDKIFLASVTEVGAANEPGGAEGSLLPLFSDDISRIAVVTEQVEDYSNYDITGARHYWLRSPRSSNSYDVCIVYSSGAWNSGLAYYGARGVRPLCNLKSDILVSDVVDSDGCYTVLV